jgi:hypothetical protein
MPFFFCGGFNLLLYRFLANNQTNLLSIGSNEKQSKFHAFAYSGTIFLRMNEKDKTNLLLQ